MVRARAPWTDTGPVRSCIARALFAATRVPTDLAVVGTLLALVVAAVIDSWIGARWSLGLFYYLPVAFAAWRLGRGFALLAGGLCSLGWVALMAGGGLDAFALAWGFGTHILSFAVVAVLVSEMRDLFERERRMARHCHLTGALSGRAFRDVLDQTVAAARRRSEPVALVYADMDDFKQLNDRHGHGFGDVVLETFARGVRAALGPHDHFARTGGDEFVVLLSGREGQERAAIEAIRASVRAALGEFDASVSTSMGAIILPAGRELDPGELVRRADKAMYEAKRAGKGGLCVFEVGGRQALSVAA